ncbi:alpha-mannosidase [bacterium]|nr:alpha-mannosidase [bacterium]
MANEGMRKLEQLHINKIRKRINEIRSYIWTEHEPADVAIAETMHHITPTQATKLKYKAAKDGRRWGKPWSTAWFRIRGVVPKSFAGHTVSLIFDPEGECAIFRDGVPVQGLDRNRKDYVLFDEAKGGEKIEVYVEAGASGAFGEFGARTMRAPSLAIYNADVWDAFQDIDALAAMVDPLPGDDTRRARIVRALAKAVDLFDYQNGDELTALSRRGPQGKTKHPKPSPDRLAELRDAVRRSARAVCKALKPIYAQRANASAQTIACMGHAHIDVAWLWPLAETIRKCARTFSTVVEYADRYPEYLFAQSQPHLYEFTRDHYPALYERVKEKVKAGQFVPTGCFWVEADCNVTSGESLVRQTLFGTRFFKQEFDHDVACLWLPDVFGYSAALPQILRRSGIGYFLTQKISWCQFTTFPYHTFQWEGIDGSTVLTHFPPANDYNSMLRADQMLGAARRYREKDRSPLQAVPYGFGDGGGGPTKDHIERMRRYADLEGMPKLAPMTPAKFFHDLEANSEDLRTWVGELYLELHRATLTTQANNKKFNRKCELALRDAEILSSLGLLTGGTYRQNDLNAAWKTVLLNQFHDIIPGSSITLVYEDSDRHYAEVLAAAADVKQAALAHYAKGIDAAGEGIPVLAFNSLSWERTDIVAATVPGLRKGTATVAVAPDGTESPVQLCGDGLARWVGTVPSIGHAVFHIKPGETGAPAVQASGRGMENDRIRLRFDKQGRIRSIYDKANRREVVAPGAVANQLILFEDKPANWDAWDMDIFYNDKPLETDGTLLSIEVKETGPVGAVVRVKRAISKSIVSQDIILTAGSARVDFLTTIEWGDEKDVLLKAAFPVDVLADKARYEIQFGNVERPTHWNTPRDFGRFEVCGHKWADLCEGGYGVALLNDAKYGHDIRGNVMRLSLLRAPKTPDPEADIHKTHTFTYSLLPHAGDYAAAGIVRQGYQLNVPVIAQAVKATDEAAVPNAASQLAITGDNVIIDTVKKAEDDGGIIVRLYEAHACRGRRTLALGFPVKKVLETNLMEKEERELPLRNGKVALDFTPFQIRTLKLVV